MRSGPGRSDYHGDLVRAFLWIAGSILVLDVLLVAVFAACAAFLRHRRAHSALYVDVSATEEGTARHHLVAVPDVTEIDAPGQRDIGLVRETSDAQHARARSGGHRAVSVAVVAAMIVAGSAVASPEVRRFVATAIDAVAGGSETSTAAPAEDVGVVDDGTTVTEDGSPATPDTANPSADPRPQGDGTPAPAVDPRPAGTPHGVQIPATPTAVTAVPAGSGAIVLSWADVAGETGYRVDRSPDGLGGWVTVATPSQGETTVTDAGLSPGTTYFYEVVAIDGHDESAPSNVVSATTGIDAPSATTVMIVAVTSDHIDLAWNDVSGETGYRIERSTDGTGWTPIATTGIDVTTATDAGLSAGTTYAYRIFATNDAGDSPASEVVSATTDPDPGTGVDPAPTAKVSTRGGDGNDG